MLGVIETYRGRCAILAGDLQRKGTARNGDDASPSLRGKRCQERPKKPNTHNGHCLARVKCTAAKNVHGAAEGLSREGHPL
jgi:hypothetical protein